MATRFATANEVEPMLGPSDAENLRTQFNALLADVLAIRTLIATYLTIVTELKLDHNAIVVDITDIRTKFNAVLTKLDADAGVTDTNYSATQAASALTTTAIAAATPAAAAAATGLALTEV